MKRSYMLKGKSSAELLTYTRTTSNDECYTPAHAVEALIPYIHDYMKRNKKDSLIVWCPFDTHESEFVKILSCMQGVHVTYSHISNNQDFFTYEPTTWDIIISNPPFANKRAFFEQAISFKKPFALLMSVTWLNDSAPYHIFKDINFELLFFSKRIHFLNDGKTIKKTTFASAFFCSSFLSSQITFSSI